MSGRRLVTALLVINLDPPLLVVRGRACRHAWARACTSPSQPDATPHPRAIVMALSSLVTAVEMLAVLPGVTVNG